MSSQNLVVLGSTGSIGRSTLDVVRRHPERFNVIALCANRQIDRLFDQCVEFDPLYAVVGSEALAARLEERLRAASRATSVAWGEDALVRAASLPEADAVMAAIVGSAGLPSAFAAARAGKKILLANKETLVMGGEVFMRTVRENRATLVPIDSEHNAIFQSLPHAYSGDYARHGVEGLVLTGSGGPFRTHSRAQMRDATPEEACAHPKWSMGKKISVDSATLMNKGLEMIEAHWLFGMPVDRIEIAIHPQSVVHSLVRYADGSVLAELGNPDMRTPIAQALAYPERIASGVGALDLFKTAPLCFDPPDFERFPCLSLAYRAIRAGKSAPTVLNIANEVAVEAFLDRKIGFCEIPEVIEAVMDRVPPVALDSMDDILAAGDEARRMSVSVIGEGVASLQSDLQ
ncbi:MAG: 1-deoxy-D-xylulose-5-phosphate reductoisomerase [Candidatus Accumulibacter sp.]|jgi:1-deoxy-D-xylulose-5-phosphate reductoisomerase|nr:1-deoxy-D-xylulose-5-phosphate reductoisomerase [Accumulibacter sp.]